MGAVRDVKVRTGDSVSRGQLLVTIDSRDLDVAVRERQAAREEAISARGEIEHAVAAAQANLDLARVTFRRMQELYDKKSISDQEYAEATARLKAAQAGLRHGRRQTRASGGKDPASRRSGFAQPK